MTGQWSEKGSMTGQWSEKGSMTGQWSEKGSMTGQWSEKGSMTGQWSEKGSMTGQWSEKGSMIREDVAIVGILEAIMSSNGFFAIERDLGVYRRACHPVRFSASLLSWLLFLSYN